jgi:hypothetical protein
MIPTPENIKARNNVLALILVSVNCTTCWRNALVPQAPAVDFARTLA